MRAHERVRGAGRLQLGRRSHGRPNRLNTVVPFAFAELEPGAVQAVDALRRHRPRTNADRLAEKLALGVMAGGMSRARVA